LLSRGVHFFAAASLGEELPGYQHVIIIVDESKDFSEIVGTTAAPNMTAWAARFGVATHYDAVARPSEPNYVAARGGKHVRDHGRRIDCDEHRACPEHSDADRSGASSLGKALYGGLYAAKHSGFLNLESVRTDTRRAEDIAQAMRPLF
jgi:hypothetical protein